MRSLSSAKYFALLAGAALVAACGGGGGADSAGGVTPGTGASTNTTSTVGVITGFGSVHVNGVHYRTGNNTEIMIRDARGDEGSLKVGQIVTLIGSIDSDGKHGQAYSISMQEALRGPITSIDTDAGSFVALGQTVLVNEETMFDASIDPADLTALSVDDIVEVSGFRDTDGAILASFIEFANPNYHFEVVGTVAGLDPPDAKTFMIGDLVIDFSTAQIVGFESGAPVDGDLVEVEGTAFSDTGVFLADQVKLESTKDDHWHHHDHNGDYHRTELEGLITRFESPTDFDVDGKPVTTTETTSFEHGTAANLALDLHVEVKGSVDENGVLVASKVEMYGISTVRIGGLVDVVSPEDNTLTVLGISVQVDESTRYRDDSSAMLRTFGIADVTVGDYVEISGYVVDEGTPTVLATKLRRENGDADSSIELSGPAVLPEAMPDTLVVLGVTVTTDAATLFLDRNYQSTDATGFFGALAPDDVVKVRGVATSLTPPASVLATKLMFGKDYSANDHHHHH
jgi:hypothetical protein